MACNPSRGAFWSILYGEGDKTSNKQESIYFWEKYNLSITRHFNERNISLFSRRSAPRVYAWWFILIRGYLIIILLICVHCARKPGKRDINRRPRYFRCFGQMVSYYSRPSPFISCICQCRWIITGFRSGKYIIAFPRLSKKRAALFLPIAFCLLFDFSLETCLRMKSISYASIFIPTLSTNWKFDIREM